MRMGMRGIVDRIIHRGGRGRRCKDGHRGRWSSSSGSRRRIDWSGPFEQAVVIGRCLHKSRKLKCEILRGEYVVW